MPPTYDEAVQASTATPAAPRDDNSATTSAVRTRAAATEFGTQDAPSLYDLVQRECAARSARIVRIASQGRAGYLFFKDGQIVHATTKDASGERAARAILAWSEGLYEPCQISWPECLTIGQPWQSLFSGRAGDRRPSLGPPAPPLQATEPERAKNARASTRERSASTNFERAVRVDAAGTVLSRLGDADGLAGLAAYAARLAELVGSTIGLDKFMALDLELEASRCVLLVETSGNVVAVQARNGADLNAVAKRAGL